MIHSLGNMLASSAIQDWGLPHVLLQGERERWFAMIKLKGKSE